MAIDERGFLDLEVVASEAIGIGNPGDLEVRVYGSTLLISSSLYNALEASSINLFRASDLFLFLQEMQRDWRGSWLESRLCSVCSLAIGTSAFWSYCS